MAVVNRLGSSAQFFCAKVADCLFTFPIISAQSRWVVVIPELPLSLIEQKKAGEISSYLRRDDF